MVNGIAQVREVPHEPLLLPLGMGKVEVVQYDGKGHLLFDQRPYLVMNDRAYVDLGFLKAPLKGPLEERRGENEG